MKRLLLIALVLSVAVQYGVAADTPKPMAKAGDKAILFDLSGLANLGTGTYEGGVGFQWYFMKNLAVRIGIGFGTSTTTTKNPTDPVPTNVLSESDLTGTSFTVTPAVRYNLAQSGSVLAYVGLGVSFTTSNQERTGNSNGFGTGYVSGAKYSESSTMFGAALLFGAEWFPWENISFAGEYRFGFSTESGKAEATYPAPTPSESYDAPTTTSFGTTAANSAHLTLSVFF